MKIINAIAVSLLLIAAASVRAATSTVEMRNNFFSPASVTINPGDTVTWVQRGSNHDTVSYDGLWSSGTLAVNRTFSFKFDDSGTYRYFCTPHENLGMKGTITVRASNQLPTVTLASDQAGKVTGTGTPVKLTATASDPDGTVLKVEFFAGSTSLGSDTSAPFELTISDPAPGMSTITAVATDNAGGKSSAAGVEIRVAARPLITAITRNTTEAILTVSGTSSLPHVLEKSSDFVNWVEVGTSTPADGTVIFSDALTANARFYRVTVR